MLTGRRPSQTGALYIRPDKQSPSLLSLRYSLADMQANPDVVPLWQRINQLGGRVGIMNIPTTYPAPEVEGFFVSGAGGGLNRVEGIPDEMCFPRSIKSVLENHQYILDLRLGATPYRDPHLLCRRIDEMMARRTAAFVELARTEAVDFGFIGFRGTTVLQYLAMYEIESLLTTGKTATPYWQPLLASHYRLLDEQIAHLMDSLQPSHVILTSDHGCVPWQFNNNINGKLLELGLVGRHTAIRRSIKKILSTWGKGAFTTPLRDLAEGRMALHESLAFGHWYLPGIYINDKRRFGGPIQEDQIETLVTSICNQLSEDPTTRAAQITPKPYRRGFSGEAFFDELPDIWLDCPDSYFFHSEIGPLSEPNPNYGPLETLEAVNTGMHSGQKGRHPIFLCDEGTASLRDSNSPTDLRLVYELASRLFESATRNSPNLERNP